MVKVLLHSGGLDSHICWHLGGRTAQPVYVRIDAVYQDKELDALERLADADPSFCPLFVSGPSMRFLEQESGRIAHRNLILAATAAAFTDADVVQIGAVAGEASSDKSGRFMRNVSRTLSASEGRRVTLEAPIRHLTKAEALQLALATGQRWEDLAETVSCYHPTERSCGECLSCYRRALAEWACGIISTPPPLPARRGSVIGHALKVSPVEWPAVLRNNVLAARAWLTRRRLGLCS